MNIYPRTIQHLINLSEEEVNQWNSILEQEKPIEHAKSIIDEISIDLGYNLKAKFQLINGKESNNEDELAPYIYFFLSEKGREIEALEYLDGPLEGNYTITTSIPYKDKAHKDKVHRTLTVSIDIASL